MPEGANDEWLHVLHRQKAGRDIILVANQNHEGGARNFNFCVAANGEPECWDAMRNEITTPRFRRINARGVVVTMTLEPLETVLLVFQPEEVDRPPRIEPDTKPIREPIMIVREPPQPQSRGVPPTPDLKRKPLTLAP